MCRTLPDFNWHARVARSLSDSWASCCNFVLIANCPIVSQPVPYISICNRNEHTQITQPNCWQHQCWLLIASCLQSSVSYLVSWSLTSLFSTNMAISETKQSSVNDLQIKHCTVHNCIYWPRCVAPRTQAAVRKQQHISKRAQFGVLQSGPVLRS